MRKQIVYCLQLPVCIVLILSSKVHLIYILHNHTGNLHLVKIVCNPMSHAMIPLKLFLTPHLVENLSDHCALAWWCHLRTLLYLPSIGSRVPYLSFLIFASVFLFLLPTWSLLWTLWCSWGWKAGMFACELEKNPWKKWGLVLLYG